MYVSWYQAGLQVFDIDPASGRLQLIRTFDTSAYSNNGSLEGNWGVYPFLGDDRVLLTDTTGGFFIVDTTTLSDQCIEVVTTNQVIAPTWGWYTGINDSANRPALTGPVSNLPLDAWQYGPWGIGVSDCGEPNAAFELLTTTPDIGTTCICTRDDDCGDNDACTQDVCSGACLNMPRVYGDVDANTAVNLFDLFCVLDGFGGDFSNCAFVNVDIEPCPGNGTLNIFDLFAVLDAFSGIDPCQCTVAP